MTSRSLVVQSVLYGNPADDIRRAVAATVASVTRAVDRGLVDRWEIRLGDCSPEAVLDAAAVGVVKQLVGDAGGSVSVTVFGANLGSAAGHNALAAECDTELLLILNPDAIVSPFAIERLLTRIVGDVGMVEARQVPIEHPKDYDAATGDTPWASTACAVTTREVFDEVGGFDSETFFLYCDDVDYSWRVRLAGRRVLYAPEATVFHDKRLLPDGGWPAGDAEVYYSAEAALLLAHKYSRPDLVAKLRSAFASDGELQRKALTEFELRDREGRLPTPIDPRHRVSSFIKGNYARHRF